MDRQGRNANCDLVGFNISRGTTFYFDDPWSPLWKDEQLLFADQAPYGEDFSKPS